MRSFIGLFVILLIFPSFAQAARPLSTDDAPTVDKGHLEVESGFEYADGTDDEYNWTACFKYGMLEKWDMGVEIPYQYIEVADGDDVDGLSDITLTSKFRLFDEVEGFPAVSFVFSLKTDTGNDDKGLGSGEKDYGLSAVLTKTFEKNVAHLNLGYTYVGAPEGESHDDVFSYALALEYPLNERLNLVGELTGETNFAGDFDDNPFAGLVGLNFALSDRVAYDLGVGFGISDASSDYTITTGLTLSF